MVVVAVSAWEAYVEEVVKEALNLINAQHIPATSWAIVTAPALMQVKRFNTPDAGNTKSLISSCLGLADVTVAWRWRNSTPKKACTELDKALQTRHKIAHGVNPRPTIHHNYASWLPSFFKNLASCTDAAIADHLVSLGLARPW
jgi:hypothetical protein